MDDRIRPRPEQRLRLTVYEMYNRQSYISPKHKIFQRIYITENISLSLINKLVTLTNLSQICVKPNWRELLSLVATLQVIIICDI